MTYYYKSISGWCDFHNLYEDMLINKLPEGSNFVEVGTWHGHSICYAAELLKFKNKKINLYAIDIFADELDNQNKPYSVDKNKLNCYSRFLLNLSYAGVLDKVVPMALFSEDASKLFKDESIDCVFLDAAHDEKNVINDLNHWFPKVKKGGYICGHDYINGIKPIVDKWFMENHNVEVQTVLPHCFLYKK